MPLLAHLDNKGILQKFEKVSLDKCKEGVNVVPLSDQDECDLEPGKYKWDPKVGAFIPLGFGFGKPKPGPRLSTELLLFYLITAMKEYDPSFPNPIVVDEWLEWYETELLKREEELLRKRGK